VGIAVTSAGEDVTTTFPPAVRGVPAEADVGRRVSQPDAPAAAIARPLMTSIEGPVAAKACAACSTHMGCMAGALSRRLLRRAVASRGRRSVCSSRRARDAPPAAHAWAARRARPPPAPAVGGGRIARVAQRPPSRRERDTPPAAHAWAARRARALGQRWLGRAVASRGRHSVCSSRRARDAPPAAHMWAARCTPRPAAARGGGWGGRVARAAQRVLVPPRSRCAAGGTHVGRTARALRQRRLGRGVASPGRHSACRPAAVRPAAVVMSSLRCTRGPHGARPSSALTGEGGRVARAARRARSAALAMRSQRHTHGPRGAPLGQRRPGRAVASHGRHIMCSSRRDRDAPSAAHTWAARRVPSASAGWGGWPGRAGGTARARPAVIAMRRRRHSCGPHGARPQPASPGDGGSVARAGQRVPDLPHSRSSADGTHMGRTARARPQPAPAGEGGRVARAAQCAASRAGHTLAARGMDPPAPDGEGGSAERAAQRVPVPQRSRRRRHTYELHGGHPPPSRGGRSRRAGGTARARPAIRQRRHTPRPRGARPPPASAWEGCCIVRAAQHVLITTCKRRH
jgi:hypothetical protein